MNTVNFITIPGTIAPDKEIVVFGGRRLTYAQLADLVARIGAGFKQLKLARRDVVAVLDTNSDLYLASYYAAAKSAMVFLPLNYRATQDELEYMIGAAGTRLLLVGDRYLGLAERLRPRLEATRLIALEDGTPGLPRLSDLVAGCAPDPTDAEVEEDETSVLMYTSGTTSRSKCVILSYGDFTAYVTANVELADASERGVALVCAPFYHIAGMTAVMTNLWTGRRIVVMAQFEPRVWLELVERERVTHAFVVPTMLKQLLDEPALARTDLASLVQLAYGGAPMPLAVILRALEVFPRTVGFVNAYGQTETTSSLTVLGPEDHRLEGSREEVERKLRRLASIGKPLRDVEIRVLDENERELGPDRIGELVVRTPRATSRYLGQEEPATPKGGWRATGDLGWIDADGYVYFAGRKDDLIIRGGENVAPAEVEAVLMSHPAVAEAAVVGRPSLEWGEKVRAFVALRRDRTASAEELKEFCRSRLAPFKRPETVEFVDELPKSPLGKVLRKELRGRP